MREAFLTYWRGVLIAVVLVIATVWLAATDRLGLYIHPRYFGFTVAMAAIGGAIVLAAFLVPRREDDEHVDGHGAGHGAGHGHAHAAAPPTRRGAWRPLLAVLGSILIVAAAAGALLALPPTTLSATLAGDREVNGSITVGDGGGSPVLVGGDTSGFTVKDWAVLIRQGGSDSVLRSASPTIEGFIVPVDGTSDAFTITRYSITCCAVDAQPFGVTVLMPGWREGLAEGGWVSATGRFVENPDAGAAAGWVLQADDVVAIDEPSDPYVF